MMLIPIIMSVMISVVTVNNLVCMNEEEKIIIKQCGKQTLELFKKNLKPNKEERACIFESDLCKNYLKGMIYLEAVNQGNEEILNNPTQTDKQIVLEATKEMHKRAKYHNNGGLLYVTQNRVWPVITKYVIPGGVVVAMIFSYKSEIPGKITNFVYNSIVPSKENSNE